MERSAAVVAVGEGGEAGAGAAGTSEFFAQLQSFAANLETTSQTLREFLSRSSKGGLQNVDERLEKLRESE
jgi:hypothetical protein